MPSLVSLLFVFLRQAFSLHLEFTGCLDWLASKAHFILVCLHPSSKFIGVQTHVANLASLYGFWGLN